jgi:hypothetical protein
MRGRAIGLAAFVALVGRPATAQLAEPMQIRNLNPLVAIFGLPAWDTVAPGNRFSASLEIAQPLEFSSSSGEALEATAKLVRTTLGFSHGFASGWQIGVELPLFHLGGGVLDNPIDAWHSAFNLPDGGRNLRPENQLSFVLRHSGLTFFRLDEPQSGLGDLQLKGARAFGPDRGFVLEAGVKLATGDTEMLAGSGSTDEWLTLLRSRPLTDRRYAAGYYWGFGVARRVAPKSSRSAEEWVYTGILGVAGSAGQRFGLKAQLDVHAPFYDSRLEEIGDTALEATFGAWMQRRNDARLEFAIVEDLRVRTAPDVVFKISAHWSL